MNSKTKSKYYIAIGRILKEERNRVGYSLDRLVELVGVKSKSAEGVSIRKGIVSVFLVRSLVTHF